MSTGAIVMMLVAMMVLWGGLALAVYRLNKRGATSARMPGRDL